MKVLYALAFFPFLLLGEMTTSSISSGNASYDGSVLILRGAVKFDHPLGKMESRMAQLKRKDADSPFSTIHLHDQVNISLKNHGHILCEVADFNFNTMSGTLFPKKGEVIRFVNLAKGFSLSSQGAHVSFAQTFDKLKIAKITSDSAVDVEYGDDFSLKADGITYTDDKVCSIKASPNCTLTHFGDKIQADEIQLYLDPSRVVLKSPIGKLCPTSFSATSPVEFSCDRLIWEKALDLLRLNGHIRVDDETIGTIESEDEVELRQKQKGDRWIIATIASKGKTKLRYRREGEGEHTLISSGGVTLDSDHLTLTAQRSYENPLLYFHNRMTLEADYAQLDYTQDKDRVCPEKLLLLGGIRLSSEGDNARCALADQFVYQPEEKMAILKAKNDNQVLFWDEELDLSISANEVHITQTERGEKVKGVGNVRFAFSSTESALLRKLFPFYQPQGGTL